jgi:hypothetical protein
MHTRSFGFLRSLVTVLSLVTMLVGAVGPMPVLASPAFAPTSVALQGHCKMSWGVRGIGNPSAPTRSWLMMLATMSGRGRSTSQRGIGNTKLHSMIVGLRVTVGMAITFHWH